MTNTNTNEFATIALPIGAVIKENGVVDPDNPDGPRAVLYDHDGELWTMTLGLPGGVHKRYSPITEPEGELVDEWVEKVITTTRVTEDADGNEIERVVDVETVTAEIRRHPKAIVII